MNAYLSSLWLLVAPLVRLRDIWSGSDRARYLACISLETP